MTTFEFAKLVSDTSVSEVLRDFNLNTTVLEDETLADLIDEIQPLLLKIDNIIEDALIFGDEDFEWDDD
jgi:hypothetical protein